MTRTAKIISLLSVIAILASFAVGCKKEDKKISENPAEEEIYWETPIKNQQKFANAKSLTPSEYAHLRTSGFCEAEILSIYSRIKDAKQYKSLETKLKTDKTYGLQTVYTVIEKKNLTEEDRSNFKTESAETAEEIKKLSSRLEESSSVLAEKWGISEENIKDVSKDFLKISEKIAKCEITEGYAVRYSVKGGTNDRIEADNVYFADGIWFSKTNFNSVTSMLKELLYS